MAIITLADAKAQLNIDPTDTTYDTELQGYVDATQQVAEDIAGTIVPVTLTGEVHDGGGIMVTLRRTPVITLTTVTEYVGRTAYTLSSQPLGSTADNYGYDLIDSNGGVLLRRSASGTPMPFQGGDKSIVVTYQAGYATTPQAIRLGALVCMSHWWTNMQQGFPLGGNQSGIDGGTSTIAGYSVPDYAVQLFASLKTSPRRIPGIA